MALLGSTSVEIRSNLRDFGDTVGRLGDLLQDQMDRSIGEREVGGIGDHMAQVDAVIRSAPYAARPCEAVQHQRSPARQDIKIGEHSEMGISLLRTLIVSGTEPHVVAVVETWARCEFKIDPVSVRRSAVHSMSWKRTTTTTWLRHT